MEGENKKVSLRRSLFLISFTVVLAWSLFNYSLVGGLLRRFLGLFYPFILGGALAFIFYNPMEFFETRLFKSKGLSKKLKRLFSFILTIAIFLAVIIIVAFIVLPEVRNSLMDLAERLPDLVKELEEFLTKNLSGKKEFSQLINSLGLKWLDLNEKLMKFIGERFFSWMDTSFKFASSLIGGLVSLLIAFVFSIYILFQREELGLQLKKLSLAYMKEEKAERLFYIGRLSSDTFSKFLTGQLTEAIIIGLMFFVSMLVFKFPYALVISLLIGLMSLIPLVGSFIGLAIGLFLIMLVDLKLAFWFVIMFIVIQQIEGNLIYPRIVGKASGLPSIWVLVAVSLGGNLMGILGIVLFIPLAAIGYSLLKENVYRRLDEKNISLE